jgi:hypothetical protein
MGQDDKRSKYLLAFLAALLVAGCTDHEVERAKAMVAHDQRDPASVQFRDVRRTPGSRAICGEANGKNAMGAYVGYSHFIVTDSQQLISDDGNTGAFSLRWRLYCDSIVACSPTKRDSVRKVLHEYDSLDVFLDSLLSRTKRP